jgi:hypothetical protein
LISPRRTICWLLALCVSVWGCYALAKPVIVVSRVQPPDATAPLPQGWVIQEDGVTHILTFDEVVTGHTGFTYSMSGMGTGTLAYVSGEGTLSLTFTSNDATASGETGDGDYTAGDVEDAATNALANFSNFTITNNADPPSDASWDDPDLPEAVDSSLPAHWNAAADHSPANNAALQELLDGDSSGDVAAGDIISLDADVDYGTIIVDDSVKGTSGNEIIIRSDEYTDLPAYGTRVTTADEIHMPTMSRAPSAAAHILLNIQSGASAAGAQYIRWIGIKFTMTGTFSVSGGSATDITAMIAVGQSTTTIANLPTDQIFDRCAFTADDGIDIRDTICLNCVRSAVVHSNFYNLDGAVNDGSNGVRIYCGGPAKIHDNYQEVQGAGLFLGDNGYAPPIVDVTYSHNHKTADMAWQAAGTQKSCLETKNALRLLVENNIFENHWAASFQALCFKADGSGGPKSATHITVRYNDLHNVKKGILFHVNGSSPGATVGPNSDMLAEHNLMYDFTGSGSALRFVEISCGGLLERVKVRHNTFIGPSNYVVYFHSGSTAGADPGINLLFDNNIVDGGCFTNAGSFGAVSFNASWTDTYLARNNAWIGRVTGDYDTDASPAPTGTLTGSVFPATVAAVQFENSASDDYRLASGSPYNNAGTDGTDIGCDVTELNTRLTGVEGP